LLQDRRPLRGGPPRAVAGASHRDLAGLRSGAAGAELQISRGNKHLADLHQRVVNALAENAILTRRLAVATSPGAETNLTFKYVSKKWQKERGEGVEPMNAKTDEEGAPNYYRPVYDHLLGTLNALNDMEEAVGLSTDYARLKEEIMNGLEWVKYDADPKYWGERFAAAQAEMDATEAAVVEEKQVPEAGEKISPQQHLELLLYSVKEWNRWYGSVNESAKLQRAELQRAELQRADLRDAKLWFANLQDADLRDADLQRADLQGADLRRAKLWFANLQDADLRDADLQRADLRRANLRRTNLSSADLRDAILWDADLSGADLLGAKLQNADLSGADLSGADLQGAVYNASTTFPEGFDPEDAGMISETRGKKTVAKPTSRQAKPKAKRGRTKKEQAADLLVVQAGGKTGRRTGHLRPQAAGATVREHRLDGGAQDC
jgi:hypothetical protein